MDEPIGFIDALERLFGRFVVDPISALLFFDVWFWDDRPGAPGVEVPIVVLWLLAGATFFTLRFRFVNLRGFRHGIDCVRGRYARPDDPGEISSFQALAAALSATVGMGNIAGVAVAVELGGPGAVFWMVVAGFLGMSSKFAEVTLAQMYRTLRRDGHVSGGPMHYLSDGLARLGWPRLGTGLAVVFSLMCIGGSLGGGNMFQANQAYAQAASVVPFLDGRAGAIGFGVALAFAVGLVIVGGIRRIGEVAAVIVPFMCALYVLCGMAILLVHADQLGHASGVIVSQAFTPDAAYGGFVAVLMMGFRRACFSNEAGIGSAPIAHSAAATPEPARQGFVALLEPFIDTVIVCHMTGLVCVVTGAYAHPEAGNGIAMTSFAFATVFPWFPALLSLAALLFAFSTQISWSYYGEQCWARLFGVRSILAYKALFLFFAWFGAVSQLDRVIEFSDLMILGMAFPNLAGVLLLSNQVKRELDRYWARLRAGEFARAAAPSRASSLRRETR
jgi:AGCS family alanine or glycine:cation symporter